MTLKPYHEHELLHNYSVWPSNWRAVADAAPIFRAEWYCNVCRSAIEGPPWVIGDYVVRSLHRAYRKGVAFRRVWQVHMRASWEKGWHDGPLAVYESPRKREALKHARMLERGRLRLIRQIERGDAKLLADIYSDVKRVEREERDSECEHRWVWDGHGYCGTEMKLVCEFCGTHQVEREERDA